MRASYPHTYQQSLGIIAPERRPMTASQREMLRRAGTTLSIQQQMAARRLARSLEAAHDERKATGIVRVNSGLRSIASILSGLPAAPHEGDQDAEHLSRTNSRKTAQKAGDAHAR